MKHNKASGADADHRLLRRYKFRLFPTRAQAAILHDHRKMMVDLWNALKQRREDVYSREKRSLSFYDLTNEITELRHACEEWRDIPAITAHRVAKRLIDAYNAFFRRLKAGEAPGYPEWHRRELGRTIPLSTMNATGWRLVHRDRKVWRLHYGSVTDIRRPETWITALGELPATPIAWPNADIIWRDQRWFLSVCVEMPSRRQSGDFPATVRLDLLDDFASVNGIAETPKGLYRARELERELDERKSDLDRHWPRGRRRSDEEQEAFVEARRQISALAARIARIRHNALHVWSTNVVARASELIIIAPAVRENTRTPHGNQKQWGAQVATVSELNRNTLSQAPATAVAMLEYKAKEAGLKFEVVCDQDSKISVGADLVTAGRIARRARRAIKQERMAS